MTQAVLHPDGSLTGPGSQMRRATFGRGGLRADKQEGDGATPVGMLPLRRVLYRADRVAPPDCAVPLEPIAPDDGWCDDPADSAYNRMIRLPYGARHEALWRSDGLYDVVGVLGWNDAPIRPGRGSAIFLHVAGAGPTEGCIALPLAELQALLARGLSEILVVG